MTRNVTYEYFHPIVQQYVPHMVQDRENKLEIFDMQFKYFRILPILQFTIFNE